MLAGRTTTVKFKILSTESDEASNPFSVCVSEMTRLVCGFPSYILTGASVVTLVQGYLYYSSYEPNTSQLRRTSLSWSKLRWQEVCMVSPQCQVTGPKYLSGDRSSLSLACTFLVVTPCVILCYCFIYLFSTEHIVLCRFHSWTFTMF
jgi:hypothetical protein